MDKLELVIPSAISQSLFIEDDKLINLNGSEINYFFLLLYLYREELLKVNGVLDVDENKNYTLNQDNEDFSVKIRLWWFNEYKAVKSKKYTELKTFLKKLQHYTIVMNVLEKNKEAGVNKIKLVKSYSIDKATINIEFKKSFLEKYIVYGSQFMAVDLNNLIKLRGEKNKLLYLLLKDYSNLPKGKNLTLEELILILGSEEIKKSRIEASVEKINALNDIKVNLDVGGPAGEKIYKFKFEKEEVKPKKLKSNDTEKQLSDFTDDIQTEARIRMEDEQANGTVIKNEKRYLITVCESIVIENEGNKEQDLYKEQIDEWLEKQKNNLKDTINISEGKIPIIKFHTDDREDENYFWFITNDYKIDRSFEGQPMTKSAKETYETIEKLYENENISISTTNVYDNSGSFSKMYF